MPSDLAIARLADILETWRLFYLPEQKLAAYRKAQNAAVAALKELGEAAKIIGDVNREFLDKATAEAEKWTPSAGPLMPG